MGQNWLSNIFLKYDRTDVYKKLIMRMMRKNDYKFSDCNAFKTTIWSTESRSYCIKNINSRNLFSL